MSICKSWEFYQARMRHYAGYRVNFKKKTRKGRYHTRNEAEDRVVSRVYMNMTLNEFKGMGAKIQTHVQSFLNNEISIKDLKSKLGDQQIVLMALMLSKAFENEDEKEIKLWGEKIEAYCIQKPKPETGEGSTGADRLMEAIANVVEGRIRPGQLPESAGKGSNE